MDQRTIQELALQTTSVNMSILARRLSRREITIGSVSRPKYRYICGFSAKHSGSWAEQAANP
jgi:hypothetical protein